jgi:SsrA-binding protein
MNKKLDIAKTVNIKNKKASFEYAFLDTFVAGMVLKGTEIKSIRMGKVQMNDAYCLFDRGELYVTHLHVSEYERGTVYNHEPTRVRKLLLKKRELAKLEAKLKDKGLTVIPVRLFVSDRGFAKLEIALAKGKKLYDKREGIKERDVQRELDRNF